MNIKAQNLVNRGYSLIEQGRFAQAVEILQKAIELAPNESELYAYLGEAFYLNGQYQEANAAFAHRDELVLANDPLTPYIEGYRGCIYFRQGDITRASDLLEKAISNRVKDPEIYYNLGIVRMLEGKPAEAARSLKEISPLDPSFFYRKINALIQRLA